MRFLNNILYFLIEMARRIVFYVEDKEYLGYEM